MKINKVFGGSIAIAGIALAIGTAAPSQASCSWFPADGGNKSICGVPNMSETAQNALENLHNNFSPSNAAKNFQDNFNPKTAVDNLKKNLGLGGGTSTP